MKLRKPAYYDAFKCIGSMCRDTCCAGWEIEIDECTAGRYHDVPGIMGERLKSNITETEEEIYFNLCEGKRCPFLNQENLCDIIIHIGEEYLCDICREHPRHYEWFGDYTEVGLGLCCEEAGRLMFASETPIRYCVTDSDEDFEIAEEISEAAEEKSEIAEEKTEAAEGAEPDDITDEDYIELLLSARQTAFSIAQNRELKITERLILLLQYAEELQTFLDADDYEEMERGIHIYQNQDACYSAWKQMKTILTGQNRNPAATGVRESMGKTEGKGSGDERCSESVQAYNYGRQLLTIYSHLESLDGTWQERMERLSEVVGNPDIKDAFRQSYPQAEQYEYEHFTVYLIYRYFMQALFDGDLLGKLKFVIMSVVILRLMDYDALQMEQENGSGFTLWNRIQNAKQYSKEIEYCTENMEALGRLCWEEACMSTEALILMLEQL